MDSLNPENSPKQYLDDSGYVQDAFASENASRGYAQLLDLSDDVLLYILQYLTPRDLKALGHTCPRLGTLICDRTLWTKVDHRTSPVGQQRLRWLLTHCLCPATTELKIAGYANKFSRCLGIQDLHWPEEADQDFIRGTCIGSQEGADVEHFLLRMWYPHLPRFAVSPRWPDKAEADSKNAKAEAESKKAAEAAAAKAAEAAASKLAEASSSSGQKAGSLGPSSSSSCQNSSSNEHNSEKADTFPARSSSDKPYQDAGCSYLNSKQNVDWSIQNYKKSDKDFDCSTQNCGKPDQHADWSTPNCGKLPPHAGCSSRNSSKPDQHPDWSTPNCGKLLPYAGCSSQNSSKPDQHADWSTPKCGKMPQYAGCSSQNSSKPDQYVDWSTQKCNKPDQHVDWSNQNCEKPDQHVDWPSQNCGKSDQNSSTSGNSSMSGQNPSNSSQNPDNSESKKENKCEYLFEDDVTDDCKGPQFTLTTNLMRDLRKTCANLTSLALEYCNLDYKTTNLRHFPMNLKKLSLRGTRCYNLPLNTSYLGKVQQRLPQLEYLDVSECDWFEPASLMPLSKLAALTELYMRDCRRLTECVAYASLSTRYGFKKLRVFDVRGSPLADSEVSALGWLPLLEELYVAPPEEFSTVSEHTHSWADTKTVFTELDSWELEEPDYYKVKSPEWEQEDDEKDEEPDNERQGDVIINNPWWAHERRIIVIQPNASRQELEQRYPPRQRQPDNEEDENFGQPRQAPRRPGERQPGPADLQQGPADPQPGPANPRPGPAYPLPLQLGSIDIVPINPPRPMQDQPFQLANFPGAVNPRPVPLDPRQGPTDRPGPANPQPGPAHQQPGPANPQAGPANPGEGTSKRRLTVGEAIDLAKRRRLEVDEEVANMQIPLPADPANFPPYNPEFCPRLRLEDIDVHENEPENEQPRQPGCVRFRRHDLRHIMHIDVDIHRQSTIHIGSHVGYHLVSDSSLLRLGRAENENVNYIHIGRNGVHHGSESGSRPDRSNLRILSVTGYRNITDRSLEHLVTAAPYLLHIDFTETNVTERGVELFKAVRPDCDVIFSQFGRMM